MLRNAIISVIIFLLFAVAAVYYSTWSMMQPSGKILRGALAAGPETPGAAVYKTGGFLVKWTGGDRPVLEIAHEDAPGRALWAALPGRSFVAAAAGREKALESRGLIVIKDNLEIQCANQTVDSISSDTDAAGPVTIEGELECTHGVTTGYTLTLDPVDDDHLAFDIHIHNEDLNRSYFTYASDPDEHFFGFGEQFTYFDLKGKRLPIIITEQGIGRGEQPVTFLMNLAAKSGGAFHTSYACVPHYVTSKMKSLFLENYEYSVFDMREPDKVQVKVFSPRMRGRILNGDTPAKLIEEYTEYAGRMNRLPGWAYDGAILGLQGGTEKVRRVYEQLREYDTPVAALWLQDWEGQRVSKIAKQLWWNWELDEERYPEWDSMVADMESEGVRVLGYINPFLVDVSGKTSHDRNMFAEAREKGYLVTDEHGEPYMIPNTTFSAGLVDLTHPGARLWIKEIIKDELIGAGLKGWMADYAEALPYDAHLHSGESAASYHNKYAEEWARLNGEAIAEAGLDDEIVYFSRSAFTRSPGLTGFFWLGDQIIAWDRHDGIKSAVTGVLSSGISGFSVNHSDIGGFTTFPNPFGIYQRDKELLMRWTELNTFMPIFRTHEGSFADINAQVYTDRDTLRHFSRQAKIFNAWLFYREELVRQAEETGLPVARHLFIHYPGDPAVYNISYQQYMIGDEFIVAPVLDKGAREVSAYLPTGCWTHLWTGETFCNELHGSRVAVDAPIGNPCVFYRPGSEVAARFIVNLRDAGVL